MTETQWQDLEWRSYDRFSRYYDLMMADRQLYIDFFSGQLRPDVRSLADIGCGTGFVTAALAAGLRSRIQGPVRVAGLDGSQGMLDEAERRYPDIEWVRGDLREVPLAGAFDLVVSMYNSLQHIDLSGLERSFAAIRRITTAGGRFAFDIYKPNLAYLRIPQTNRLARSLQTPDGQALEIREDTTFNEAEMCLSLAWRLVSPDRPDDRPLAETAMRIWQHQPQDVERLLASVGFRIVERFGDLDLQPYGDNAKKQVTICRAE